MSATSEPKPSAKSILATSFALFVLWGFSWALSTIHLGDASIAVALAIAAAKAALVALIFMELLHVRASVRLMAASAVAMLVLLVALVAVDVVARGAR